MSSEISLDVPLGKSKRELRTRILLSISKVTFQSEMGLIDGFTLIL
jgi:hypothetical protein